MSIRALYKELERYRAVMLLHKPLPQAALQAFEAEHHITLPPPLAELLSFFDGGELFIPGTIIYGVSGSAAIPNIKTANRSALRSQFHIPASYLLFARLNFGDFICINLNPPFDIIQWDHELDEQYCTWECLEEWLAETIQTYQNYEEGAR